MAILKIMKSIKKRQPKAATNGVAASWRSGSGGGNGSMAISQRETA